MRDSEFFVLEKTWFFVKTLTLKAMFNCYDVNDFGAKETEIVH